MSNGPLYFFAFCITLIGGSYFLIESGKYVKNGNISLWTEHFGNEKNECILLIHGAGSHRLTWPNEFCTELAEAGFFVVRYDLRDSGYSTRFIKRKKDAPVHYTLLDMAHDALAVLDAHSVKEAHIVGHSMGGMITEYLLTLNPDRIKTATIISTSAATTESMAETLKLPAQDPIVKATLIGNKPTGNYTKDRPYWIKCWTLLHGSYPMDMAVMDLYTKQFYSFFKAPGAIKNHVAAIKTAPETLASDLTKVTIPTLIIHGTEDKLVPFDHGKKIADLIPNAKLLPLEKAGHMFFNKELWDIIANALIKHISYQQALRKENS